MGANNIVNKKEGDYMPRTKLSQKLLGNEAERLVRSYIDGNMAYYNITDEDVSKALGFTVRTFYNKRSNPKTFSYEELLKIANLLHFTPVQRLGIMFGRAPTANEIREFIFI